ncbi:MAG TPA: hypothetical protein VEW74_00960, partial [Candidatus Nitrosotalea sp.]|nr:hypothetical protein [Candidatus Nitrosotalea sp.]
MKLIRACAVTIVLAGCGGGASAPPLGSSGALAAHGSRIAHQSVGLGKTLTSKNGQIYGFDINQNGSDGVLATASDVETFDENTGSITASFPKQNPSGTSYKVDGIFSGDVALVTRYVVPKGKIYAKRFYQVMNPVTAQKFTGKWTPPIKDVDVLQNGVNQATSTSALFAIELKKQDRPDVIVSDIAANKTLKVIHLDPNLFGLGNGPQFAQQIKTNQGVIALSPDGGRVGGEAPINVLVDLATGKQTQFTGLNEGPFGSG